MAGRMAAGTTSPPVESLFLVAGPGNPLILDSMDWASFDWAFHLLVLLSDDHHSPQGSLHGESCIVRLVSMQIFNCSP